MKKQKLFETAENQNENFETVNGSDEGWKDVTTFTPFHDFNANPVFIGKFIEKKFIEKLENDVLVFQRPDNSLMYLNCAYQIEEKVKELGQRLYKITFLGQKIIKGKTGSKKVNSYLIQVK